MSVKLEAGFSVTSLFRQLGSMGILDSDRIGRGRLQLVVLLGKRRAWATVCAVRPCFRRLAFNG